MSKAKGTRAERELLHMFFDHDWHCLRVAGSGSIPLPATDLLAAKAGRIFAIECKTGDKKNNRYLDDQQISELKSFARKFKAEPLLAVRFDAVGWYFLSLHQLEKSKGGNLFYSLDLAKKRGLNFKELIKR